MRWMLPFDIWYPFNVRAFGGFSIAYIFQIFGQTYVGLGELVKMLLSVEWNLLKCIFVGHDILNGEVCA